MRVVITHTDFRLYWPARIAALQKELESRGDELFVVEIAGKGSPYAFAGVGGLGGGSLAGAEDLAGAENWIRLFPDERMENVGSGRASRALFMALNELNPDVVVSGSIAFPSGATAVYWAKTRRKGVVVFDDVRPADVPRNGVVNYIKRVVYSQVDAILCPAEPWVEGYKQWGFREEQVFFGVDVVDNRYWGDLGGAAGASLPPGMPEGPFLLAVGRQIAVKNFQFLLSVYEGYRAAAGADCLPLVMVGDGPERPLLEKFIGERRLRDVHLFPFADGDTLRGFYHRAAALLLPSKAETWGLVVNEAMAAGLPVLASEACGCAPVLVREGVNGFVFSPHRPQQLFIILLKFTQMDSAAKTAMGNASRQMIEPWGLQRFAQGCREAIDYAREHKKVCRSVPAWFVLKSWKGRYRPV